MYVATKFFFLFKTLQAVVAVVVVAIAAVALVVVVVVALANSHGKLVNKLILFMLCRRVLTTTLNNNIKQASYQAANTC